MLPTVCGGKPRLESEVFRLRKPLAWTRRDSRHLEPGQGPYRGAWETMAAAGLRRLRALRGGAGSRCGLASSLRSMIAGSVYGASNGMRWLAWTIVARPPVSSVGSMTTRCWYSPVTSLTRNGPVLRGSSLLKIRDLRDTS